MIDLTALHCSSPPQESSDNVFGLSEEDLKLREVIEVDIAEEMFPEDENPDDPCTFQSKVHRLHSF